MKSKELLTVGELAKKMGTTVRTLQFYDTENILKPSAKSEGGRRLYNKKDLVKLHNILSLKYLGFSLEEIKNNLNSLSTPDEVIQSLSKQKEVIKNQIDNLTSVLSAIEALQEEVSQMQEVNFDKYADIISLIHQKNDGYWIVKFFDDKLMTHLRDRFTEHPDAANDLFKKWKQLCEKTSQLKKNGVTPVSAKGQEIAKQWWSLVMEFMDGDMSLLPKLIKFNESKQGWSEKFRKMQSEASEFMSEALSEYFKNQGINTQLEEIQ